MAAELYSNSTDARLTETLAAEYILALGDRASLVGHPSVVYGGSFAGRGSLTCKFPILGLGGLNRLAAVSEGASTTPTSVTKSSVTITGARQAMERGQSDINEMVDSVGLNVQSLVMDGLGAYAMRWQEMLCQTMNFTSSVGSTGVDTDVDDIFSIHATLLNASVTGPFLGVVYPAQINQIRTSARGEAGPFQWREDAQRFLTQDTGQGYVGSFLDIDWFASTLVQSANAGVDSRGGVFGPGAIGYMDGLPNPVSVGPVVIPAGAPMFTEFTRDARAALTGVVHNAYLGFVVLEQRGVDLLSTR